MVVPGCQQRIERCSVLTAKSLIKQIKTNSSQAVGFNLETSTLSLPLNYGGIMLKIPRRPSLWEKPRAKTGRNNKIHYTCKNKMSLLSISLLLARP